MDHARVSAAEWNLIRDKEIAKAKITKVWKDEKGNIHMELVYEGAKEYHE